MAPMTMSWIAASVPVRAGAFAALLGGLCPLVPGAVAALAPGVCAVVGAAGAGVSPCAVDRLVPHAAATAAVMVALTPVCPCAG